MICWLQHKPCAVPGLTSILGPSLGAFSADTTLVLILLWGSSKRQSHIGDDGSKVQVIFFLTGPVRKERVTSIQCACAEHPQMKGGGGTSGF